MTLVEHLGELRRRLIVAVVAFVVAATVAVVFYTHILQLPAAPVLPGAEPGRTAPST